MSKRFLPSDFTKVAIISDLHGQFLDKRAFDLFLQIYRESDYQSLIVNGDLCDFTTISSHAKKIERYDSKHLTEWKLDAELDFVEKEILEPLHKAHPKVKIVFRLGNHSQRFCSPDEKLAPAVAEILRASRRQNRTELGSLLHLCRYNTRISENAVDVLREKVAITHGHLSNAYRGWRYLGKDFLGARAVITSHTHRDGFLSHESFFGEFLWMESLCLRTTKDVEYFPKGFNTGWSNGFVDIWFKHNSPDMFVKQHKFKNWYEYEYQGVIYSA